MKSSDQPTHYFSAYPLKAAGEPSSNSSGQSPFLKAILSGKTRTLSRVRVSPMVNPYKGTVKPVSAPKSKQSKEIDPTNNEWFNNYE